VGRKRNRVETKLVESFFKHEIPSMAYLSKKKRVSSTLAQKMMIKSRDLLMRKTPWEVPPQGPLILIADAVIEMIEGKWRTVYLMLVRSVSGTLATILPPLILDGGETPQGWHEAFLTIDHSILRRSMAVVCDGHRGILYEARARRILVQRCHFHLIARIHGRRSRFVTARNKPEAHKIFRHVDTVLKNKNEEQVQIALDTLEKISRLSSSKEIRTILRGFGTNYRDFRTYMTHPELNLPTTNNTAESLASTIGYLKIRMRGFPTLNSFTKWITTLLKFRQRITCNKYQPS
jgi:hypothetical protein